jgi:hypothetical protein
MLSIFRSRRFRFIAFTAIVLITAVALTFTGFEINKRRSSNTEPPASLSTPAAPISAARSPSSEHRGQADIVHFTLYDVGIFPHEERASPGLVAIYINDLSGGSQGLVVENESGQRVGRVDRMQGRDRGRSRVALGRGRYQVYDAGRPKYRATLIVEPD